MITTLGRELVRDALPPEYRQYADEAIDGKKISQLMTELARKDPAKYNDTLQKLNNIGREVVTTYGRDASISLKDLTKRLKNQFACGGSIKNNIIELQGDHKQKVKAILIELGFSPDAIEIR